MNQRKKEEKKKNCGLYHFRHYCDVDDEILGSGNLRNSLKASIQNEIDQQQQQKEKFNCFVDFRLSTVTLDPIFALMESNWKQLLEIVMDIKETYLKICISMSISFMYYFKKKYLVHHCRTGSRKCFGIKVHFD